MRQRRVWFAAAGALLAAWACSQSDSGGENVGRASQALSTTAQSVLGFESHSQWSGVTENSSVHSEGVQSAVVPVNGWTEVTSVQLSTIGAADDALRIDILLPAETQYWGELRAIVKMPSQQEWHRELGSQSLIGLAAGSFHTLDFAVPADLAAKFENAYDDLTFTFVVNAPAGNYLLDHLSLWNEAPPDPDAGTGGSAGAAGSGGTGALCMVPTLPGQDCPVVGGEITITLPLGTTGEDVVLAANDRLEVRDRARVLGTGTPVHIVNSGDGATDVGADSVVEAGVVSTAPVDVRDRAAVSGDIRSAGAVTVSSTAWVGGNVVPNDGVDTATQSWILRFPVTPGPVVYLEPDESDSIQPGEYGDVELKSRATLHLECGLYHLESLTAHPQAVLDVSCTSDTPLVINVRNSVTWRGAIVSGDLDASRVQVAYLGGQDVLVETPWIGTLVAPNARVFLAPLNGGTHHGSFFGRSVELHPDTTVQHVPFAAWDDLPGLSASLPPAPLVDLPTSNGPPPELCTADVPSSVSAFIDWSMRATVNDWPAVRSALWSLDCSGDVAQSLIAEFQAARVGNRARAREALAALAQLRNPDGEAFFIQLLGEVLPLGEEARRDEYSYHMLAVRGLGHMGSASADAAVRDVVANHEELGIRAEGVRVYVFGMPETVKQHLVGYVRPGEEFLLDRFENRNWGQGSVRFDEQLAAYVAAHPELFPDH